MIAATQHRRRGPQRGLWILVSLGLALGCTKDTSEQLKGALEDQLKERLAKQKQEAAAVDDGGAQPELLANKLSLYLECGRATQALARESHRVYAERVAEEGELRPGVTGVVPLIGATALSSCAKAAKTGRHLQPPQPELEAATVAYSEAVSSYAARLEEVVGVLESSDTSKKIDPVTAVTIRELHPSFEAAYSAWEDASEALTLEINGTQARVDASVLARIEERAGKGAEYFTRAFVIASRPLVRCLTSEPGVACESAFFAIEQAHGELHGYLERHPEEAGKVFWMEHFLASADQYYEVARALMEKVRASEIGTEEVDAVVDEFNDLLREAGNLNFGRVDPLPSAKG